MKNNPTKKESKELRKLQKVTWPFPVIVGIIVLIVLYLIARPIILEEYCMPKAQEAAKKYKELLLEPPKDLVEAYKNRPYIIDEHSQPSPFYVELLRCELKVSNKLYPFLN